MRGVRSAGGLLALESLGFTDLFDAVYGTSAGACNAAYFLASQAALSTTVYYRDINNLRFINLLRLHKLVDLDYVLDVVIARERPLHVAKVLASRSKFFVTLLDSISGKGFLVDAQRSSVPLLTLLKASSALPIAYNRTVEVEGRACIDAGWSNLIPLGDAIEHRCTDVLVLLTQPEVYRDSEPRWYDRWMFDLAGHRTNENLKRVFLNCAEYANHIRELAVGRSSPPPGVNIATITPAETDTQIGCWTKDANRLKCAAEEYAERTLQVFGARCNRYD